MKKVSTLLASLPLITTACGGSSGGDTAPDYNNTGSLDLSQEKGIWSDTGTQTFTSTSGKVTTFQAPTALVTSQEQMIILTGNSELYVVEAGSDKAYYFSSFSFNTEIEPEVSSTTSQFTFSYYNPNREANGSVSISADTHYNNAINLAAYFSGNLWTDTYGPGAWTFTIDSGGAFSANGPAGCNATGNFNNIDMTKSELSVSLTLSGNCSGTYTGLAWPDESDQTNTLNIAVYSGLISSSKALGWKITKP